MRIFFDMYMIDLIDKCFGFVFLILNLFVIVYWNNYNLYKYIIYVIILFDLLVIVKSVGNVGFKIVGIFI